MQINQRLQSTLRILSTASFVATLLWSPLSKAACGATTITWQANANTTAWNTTTNWNPNNVPDAATENAFIVADWQIPTLPATARTLSCLEINSGSMTAPASNTLTIVGDYFRNVNAGSMIVPGGSTFTVQMSGTGTQSFENVDPIPRLTINNATTVNFPRAFAITNAFTINAGAGNINVNADLDVQQTTALVIPVSATLTVGTGVTLKLNGGVTVNGVLRMQPGSRLLLANGRTLAVGTTGLIRITGSSGNAAIINSYDSGSTYTFNVQGKIDAEYFSIRRMTATGVNITGNLQDLSNGNFTDIPNGGYGFTLGTGSTVTPTILTGLGFYGNGGSPRNINATSFTGAAFSLNNWYGFGDTANETDPGNKLNWGTEAPVEVLVSNNSPSGAPPATIARSSGYVHFGTFAFALSDTATATDVTSIRFTVDGVNSNADVEGIRVYRDDNLNCVYNAGVDSQVGGDFLPTGTPGKITVAFSAGQINLSDITPKCVHVLMATSATAGVGNTLGLKIDATDDIINSQNYTLSNTTGPPVSAGLTTVTGPATIKWNGGNSNVITLTPNWTPNTLPNATRDCDIGAGYSVPRMSATLACMNAELLSGGSLDWNNTANLFTFNGSMIFASTYTFTAAAAGIVRATGTNEQSVYLNNVTFPGNFESNATGPVTFENSGTITGNLTLNSGITRIAAGATVTVSGNIVVNNGATLDIEPGGTLVMANGRTITVNTGGTLELIGNSGANAAIRGLNNTSAYTITVSGTIRAQYYALRHLGATGLTINAAATIDGTYQLSNGSFTYPIGNNSEMLRLLRQVPTNTLDAMTFDHNGSTATGVKSVFTNTTAGTLNMTNYSGSITGAANSTSNNYIVTWVSLTNTLDISVDTTAPTNVNQGAVVNMGRFGLEQTNAGAFSNTDVTYVRLTLTGTGSASDVDFVSLYYDSACTGTGGTLIDTKPFTGNPARAEFTSITGATVQADPTTPPKRCFYATFSVAALATNGATIGYRVDSSTHIVNSQGYAFNGSASPPIGFGTSTIVGNTTYWTGATSTVWTVAGNWNGGVPNSAINCYINAATNNPAITTGTQSCNSMTIGTGTLTMSGGQLEIYGSFDNTGTFTQGGRPLIIRDNGTVATSQTVSSTSTLDNLQFNKTAGGSVSVGSSVVNVTTAMSLPAGGNFTFQIPDSKTLSAAGGLTLTAGVLNIASGGRLEIGASQTLTINGGTLSTQGVNDAYPQTLSNKATITRRGGTGTWNFTATSGTINLVGFLIEWLGTAGVNIGGTTNVTQINGGQLRNLPSTASMRAIQFNNTGTLPSTISNFGWNWGPSNSPPTEVTAYFLGFSSGCSNRTVSFDQWFGDFWPYATTNTDAKISETNCNIVIDKANSPVSLTEYKAIAYDSKVVLSWTTGLEWLHRGFNIYRSLSPDAGYVQINPYLIRNDIFSTTIHGTYAFIDEDVDNNQTYYYKLEDISNTDERTLHGPITATPNAAYGPPPPPLAGTIVSNNPSGSQSTGGSNPTDATPGLTPLETNITLVAKTANSYRLKIVVPNYTLNTHPTHVSYQQISIPLYTKSTTVGSPELLSRTLMLKIPGAASAQYTIVNETSSTTGSLALAPAPEWVLVGNMYQEQWNLDATVYSTNAFAPVSPISLGNIVNNNGQHYLPVVIQPLSYNPAQQQLKKYNELLVDIFLDGNSDWTPDAPLNLTQAWSTEGGLKIGLNKDGMYSLSFDDMLTSGVIGPFYNVPVDTLKLYIFDQEQAIDVISTNSIFDSGDTIRFFARNVSTRESHNSYALLVSDHSTASTGLRMTQVDKSGLTSVPSTQLGFISKVRVEENNVAIFNEPFDDNMDHFVWGLFYGVSGGASTPLITDVELHGIVPSTTVAVHAMMKSRSTTSTNYQHHLKLFINSSTTANAEATFSSSEPQIVTFNVPASAFVDGINRITIEPTGSLLINGEYDMVYIDYVDIYYTHDWTADNDKITVLNSRTDSDFYVDGFSANDIVGYDISQLGNIQKLINLNIQATDNGYGVIIPTAGDITFDRRFWLSTESQLLAPASLELIYGSHLKNPSNQGQVIYIGARELLDAAQPLVNARSAQGYKVATVDLDSIYNEFGLGVHSAEAVREFLNYAHTYWSVKPEYVILLGDGTYDPKGYQNPVIPLRFPVKLIKGSAFDYASDHWFVTSDDSSSAFAVIGRIPARTAEELNDYVNKVLTYESGQTKPTTSSMVLLSDKAHYSGENFDGFVTELNSSIQQWAPATPTTMMSRTQLGDSVFKSKVSESFSNSALIHYMGHGAENMWADNHIFNVNDVDALTNTQLPVIAAMNCLNANFYDPNSISLAEKLVMKKSGGAILFWGSTSMTPPSVQSVYQKAFYERLLSNPLASMGDAVKLSKSQAELQSPFKEATHSWTIIGDPLIKVAVTNSPVSAPVPSSGGGSNGCSLFAGYGQNANNPPWDLIFAFALECLIALAVIRLSVKLAKTN